MTDAHYFQRLTVEGQDCKVYCTDNYSISVELKKNATAGEAVNAIMGACNEHNVDGLYADDALNQYVQAVRDYKRSRIKPKRSAGGNGKVAEKQQQEPLKEKVTPPSMSLVQWQEGLASRYTNLKQVTEAHFPEAVWHALEFALAVSRILHIKDCSLPFMGIVLGKPSSYKTLAVELLRGTPNTVYTDQFTAKSFVSHISGIAEEKLAEIDLLPKIRNKIFLTPELAPTFSAREEDLTNIFGIITRILDGHGYESDSGAQGHRGYSGEFMFTWLGVAVEIPRRVHRLLSTLGPKIYFFRLQSPEKTEDDYLEQQVKDNFKQSKAEVYKALTEYLQWFGYCPVIEQAGTLEKMGWGSDNPEVLRLIIRFAKLLAHLRGSVPTWESRDTQGVDYAYSVATIEDPSRAITQLRNLARGHALSQGRNHITKDDLTMVAKVMLSTAPIERVVVFDLLLARKGTLSTSDIIKGINTTNPTAKRTMAEFKALGLVDMPQPEGSNTEWQIVLKDEFKWFLDKEFSQIREGSEPVGGGQNSFSKESNSSLDDSLVAERKIPPTETEEPVRCSICNHELPADELQDHLAKIHSLFGLE